MRARRLHRAISPEQRTAHAVPAVRPQPGGPLRLARSQQLADRAMAVTPGMTHTYHKRPENFAPGAYPTYLERGDGAVVWDVDGQAYVDFVCALGAATLGHNHPAVSNTLRERAGRGVLLSLPTPAEVSAAESFTAQVPGVDMVRFLKTGAEACSAAIRLARSLTGRDAVLLVGYHGWHDQLMGSAPGIPPSVAALTRRTHLDSPDAEEQFCADLDRRGDQLAAVMVSTPYHRQLDAALLQRVRQLCDRTGTLLILDEVVTGFRLAPGGLGQLRGVAADLLCFSKGLAAGMPLAAVAGPRHIMSAFATQRVSSTFAGEALSLEVMKATLQEYTTDDYYGRIARLGRRLRTGLNAAARRRGMPNFVFGYDPMPCLRFSADPTEHARTAEAFLAGMARRGVLMRRDVNFVCAAHQEEQIDFALAAADGVLSEIAVGTPAPVAPAVLR
ncbi:aminotransferase class III-fold pyridoxal phosphate-dependent enzyme [Plantactinospora sp. S1510]|uniref:Aminotransferase class III-fold pyridoxal phosphate-dependent enzyme n=2 Tax=Plantactinospora alkalitolerans TaxID=2789879 RepID=A0ABS0H183_9ACTN|nr:aminotransferase class III-fold pyridoxal phosphate-dependent enzyme [Plantactinospora alkalitolerans]